MATEILCGNGKLAVDNPNVLLCEVIDGPCAYQMYCPIVRHATNVNNATICREFTRKKG